MKAYLESEEVAKLEIASFSLRDKLLIRMLFHLVGRGFYPLPMKV